MRRSICSSPPAENTDKRAVVNAAAVWECSYFRWFGQYCRTYGAKGTRVVPIEMKIGSGIARHGVLSRLHQMLHSVGPCSSLQVADDQPAGTCQLLAGEGPTLTFARACYQQLPVQMAPMAQPLALNITIDVMSVHIYMQLARRSHVRYVMRLNTGLYIMLCTPSHPATRMLCCNLGSTRTSAPCHRHSGRPHHSRFPHIMLC